MTRFSEYIHVLIICSSNFLRRKSIALILQSTIFNLFLSTLVTASAFSVGGSLTGINGQVDISLNNTSNLSLSNNGSFSFNQSLNSGDNYLVTIVNKPANQTCTLSNAIGVISSNVTNVALSCYELPTLVEGPVPTSHQGMVLQEHLAALALVDYSQVTHAAIQNGQWANPATWHNGEIPTNNANVVIPETLSVSYASQSDVRLHTVRVDGTLTFDRNTNTRIIFDTLFVDPRGTLDIGTTASPINAQVEMIIANNGDINIIWDTLLQSRGVIAHGTTTIHGQEKTTHLKVSTDPHQGDSTLTLASPPNNWSIGDRIIVSGTFYSGFKWDNSVGAEVFFESEDEVRTITAISGNSVTLNAALEHNHVTPRADLKASIANTSRNITVSTENGASLPNHQRGHVMFMHSKNVDARYAAFEHLGRTNKSVDSFDVETIANLQPNSNVRGRYPFHFHRTGTTDKRNPAIAIGNSVFNSPGWSYVHHDSHANFFDNVSYDTFGAGFVAEVGNETGVWARNIAIKGKGRNTLNPKNGIDRQAFDIARVGSGFWFQGRMVRAIDNIASSFTHGFVYLHRGTGMLPFSADSFMLPEALQYGNLVEPDDPPIRNFDGNEAYASNVGMAVVKANPNQGHDITTVLSNFTGWEVEIGALVEYTSHYLLDNFDLIGNTREPFRDPVIGITFGNNTSDMVIRNARIDSFNNGIDLVKHFTTPSEIGSDQYVIIEPTLTNIRDADYLEFDVAADTLIANSDLNPAQFSVALDGLPSLEYNTTSFSSDGGIDFTGSKVDSIGSAPIPAGTDRLWTDPADLLAILERDGYYRTAGGIPYAVIESYFSDRASGEIHKQGYKILLGPAIDVEIQNPFSPWHDAIYRGAIDLNSTPPIAVDDNETVLTNSETIIDLAANDSDANNDPLSIDGIVAPRNGEAHDNGDGTITYLPDHNFTGNDSFDYWITDGQSNYTKAKVTVTVTTAPILSAPIIFPGGGTFDSRVGVELNSDEAGTTIYYTIDGSIPTTASTQYTTPILLTQSATLKAIAITAGSVGTVTNADFTINTGNIWQPTPDTSWQWQLTGTIDTTIDVDMYDIDLLNTPQATIDQLKADGRKVVCYFSAGSYENFRSDAGDFPASVLGNTLDGFADEQWLDIRQINLLAPVMRARLDLAASKGCDGVEPDNMDGYLADNNAGFALTADDQISYNLWIANEAHARGLSVGLKNDLEQIPVLEPFYDWALNEQCFQYDECDTLAPFTAANKAVFGVEYQGSPAVFCPVLNALTYNWMLKGLDLDASRTDCRNFIDSDNDTVFDHLDNCPSISNVNQDNNDGDTQGDICDLDDDNDGMPDLWELQNSLDPLNSTDASQDPDGDGVTNIDEYRQGSDPRVADVATHNNFAIIPIIVELLLND